MKKQAVIGEKKLPRGYQLAWSSRSISLAINFIILMQITYYCTNMLGMNAGVVGTILLASKLFDGITDLVIGFIIDKTNTKWGKARPYEIFIIPLWVITFLLFSTPDLSMVGKTIYVFILYSLINGVCATFLNATNAIYLARSLKNEKLRAKVLSMNGVLVMVLSAATSITLPIFIASWGATVQGWSKISLAFGVPLAIVGLGRFFFVKEIETDVKADKKTQKYTLKESIIAVAKNKYIFIVSSAMLITSLIINIDSAVGIYYFKYVVGNVSLLSVVGMVSLVSPFLMLGFPKAMKKVGAMGVVRVGLILGVIGNIIKYFAFSNIFMLIVGNLLSGIGIAPISVMGTLFVIDCMEYGEWKTGKRIDGVVNSLSSFASKLGSGLASGGVGIIMAISGYNGSSATQGDTAIKSIVWLYSVIPAVLFIMILIIIHFYDLERKISKIKWELTTRRNSNNQEIS